MVIDQIKAMLGKKFKVNEATIKPTTRLREDLNVDSLDAVELIMDLEDQFKIAKISDAEAQKLKTVGDIVAFLASRGIKK